MRCKCPDETLALKLSSSRRKRENHEPRRCFLRINQLSTRLRGAAGGGKEAREGARWFSVNQSRRSEGAHAQKNPQTHSRTQETRLIRSLQASQVPSRSGLSTTLVSSRDQPCPGRGSALHVGTQRPRRPSPDMALALQLDRPSGARPRTELESSRTAEPFPEIFNPRDEVKVTHSHREEKQVHGKLIWERHARTNAPHTKAFPSFRLLPTFPGLTALRRLAGDALSTRPRVWQCTERVSTAHVWCTQPRSLDSHLGPRGPKSAQGPRPARLRGSATHCTRAASHQAPFLPPPRPASLTVRARPRRGRHISPGSPSRGPSSVLPSQNRSPRAAVRPAIPPLPGDAAAHAPTAPSPRARVTG